MKYSDVHVQPLKGHKYKVLKDIKYRDVTVRAGYRTNGADIPRLLWGYIPPYWSDAMPAVIVHDYMCDVAITKSDYRKADRYFDEILKKLNVDKRKRKQMAKAVAFYTKYIREYKG